MSSQRRALVLTLGFLSFSALFKLERAPGQNDGTPIRALYERILRDRSAVAAIASSFLGALYWFTWVTYLVVFFQQHLRAERGAGIDGGAHDFCFAAAVLSAIIVLRFVVEEPIDLEVVPLT